MFEYGNPDAILEAVLPSPLKLDEAGHTVLDDFEHFCSYTGCSIDNAWAKLAFVSAATGGRGHEMAGRVRDLEENPEKAAALVAKAMEEAGFHGRKNG